MHDKLLSLFAKAGYEVVYPEGLSSSCCGMMFNSRGFKEAASSKSAQLEQVRVAPARWLPSCACPRPPYLCAPPLDAAQSLLKASENGKYPIVMDTSPCLAQIKASLSDPALRCARVMPRANRGGACSRRVSSSHLCFQVLALRARRVCAPLFAGQAGV